VLLTEKTARRWWLGAVAAVAVAVADALPSSSSSPLCETNVVVAAVSAAAASAIAPLPSFFPPPPPKCFTAPETILENQNRLSEFIATLAARQNARASAGMFFPESNPNSDCGGGSESGSLISAKQELQNSAANRRPNRIRATKNVKTMARPQRVYARLFFPFTPAAAESAQRR